MEHHFRVVQPGVVAAEHLQHSTLISGNDRLWKPGSRDSLRPPYNDITIVQNKEEVQIVKMWHKHGAKKK